MADANLLQLSDGAKAYGSRILFQGATFAVNEDEHIGLIGPNGAGKTTLLKIIAGIEELDSGALIRSKTLRLGYLEQEADWNVDLTVEQALAERCSMPMWDLKKEGRALGLIESDFSRKLSTFSGGYRMRVKLLSLIGQEPNLLLLDEPTNFLDLETVLVVERFLQGYKGAFLLISHDREFLRRVTDHIVEVEGGEVTKYPGQIDDYFEQKALLREQLEKTALNQSARKEQILDFVRRFGAKATKAKQAQSRLKQLDRMESIEIKALPVRARIPIPAPIKTGKEVLRGEGIACGYGEKPVLTGVDMVLERGQHLGIVGLNGAGKSTLLKALGGALPLQAGTLKLGMNVSFSLFSQHSADQLIPDESIWQALSRAAHPEVLKQEILNLAGGLLFGGDLIEKKIRVLSGGEKARVALGQVLLAKSSLLLLDEPTNHLDFDTVEALTEALASYEGSLITVSHDRGFIRRVATKILEVDRGRVRSFPGTYDDYVWSLQRGVLSETVNEAIHAAGNAGGAASAPSAVSDGTARRQRVKQIDADLRRLEKSLPQLEKKLAQLSTERDRLNDELLGLMGAPAATAAKKLHELSQEIATLEERMLEEMELSEEMQRERRAL